MSSSFHTSSARRAGGGLLVLAASLCAGSAAADDSALARSLFDAGMAAMSAGPPSAEVCAKFAESDRLDPAIGTRFYHAECLEKIGRTASAWAMYLDVAEAARTQKLRDHEKYARERAAVLSGKLTKMIVVVPEGVRAIAGLQIKRDGQVVGEPTYGTAIPVDPGKHQVSVSAPGRRTWTSEVEAWGEGSTITVTAPALEAEPEMRPVKTAAQGDGSAAGASGGFWGPQRILAVNATGLGVVGLALGIGLGLDAIGKLDASQPYCKRGSGAVPDTCTPEAKPLRDAGQSAAAGSTVAFIAGGALLATGAVLWLTAPGAKPSKTGESEKAARVWIAPAIGGVSAGGVF